MIQSAFAVMVLVSASYGAPLRTAGSVTLVVPQSNPARHPIDQGFLVEGGAGQGGVRGAVGFARFLEYAGLDVRAVLEHTSLSPRHATPHATYGGVEAGLSIGYARASVGVARRFSGSGPHATIFTWTVGAQIPIK